MPHGGAVDRWFFGLKAGCGDRLECRVPAEGSRLCATSREFMTRRLKLPRPSARVVDRAQDRLSLEKIGPFVAILEALLASQIDTDIICFALLRLAAFLLHR